MKGEKKLSFKVVLECQNLRENIYIWVSVSALGDFFGKLGLAIFANKATVKSGIHYLFRWFFSKIVITLTKFVRLNEIDISVHYTLKKSSKMSPWKFWLSDILLKNFQSEKKLFYNEFIEWSSK